MCLGIAGRVVELPEERPDFARVDVEGLVRDINVALMEEDPPKPGDWILIHLGFALQKMTEAEVASARATLSVLGEGNPLDTEGFETFFSDDAFRDDPFAPAGYTEG
ncbi:MAG: HypC/HybG/HupF family hydrogenase formation chaperone [Candidatus Limnocylindrales bacterium]